MRRLRDPFVTRITLPLLLAAVVLGGGQLWGESIPIPVADFNSPTVPPPDANNWLVQPVGTTFGSAPYWTVTAGSIDLLRVPDYQTPDGKQGVDMDGDNVGQISTFIDIPCAGTVTIDFYMSGCPLPPPDVKLLRLSLGSASQDFSFNYTTHGWFEWVAESAVFPNQSAGPIALTFTSLDGNLGDPAFYGPYVGAVTASVSPGSPVPDVGSPLALVALGLAALAGVGLRKK